MGSVTDEQTYASNGGHVLRFCPNTPQGNIVKFDEIPTYLFRLHAPSTLGTTTTTEVTSLAWSRGKDKEDLFDLSPSDAAHRLNAHLWWRCDGCNLMSWSSSLLFVLQHGLRRHINDFDKPEFKDIKLLILDTRKFPKGTFIKDLEALDCFHENHPELKILRGLRLRKYYFGEYLSQGRLDVAEHCSQTSLQKLLNMGLFELCPELGDETEWHRWAKRVVNIRDEKLRDTTGMTDKNEVRTAITMAQACYGSRWALPVAAMLLSLKPRKHNDSVILGGFRSMFDGESLRKRLSKDSGHIVSN